jgi:hypothetical protein
MSDCERDFFAFTTGSSLIVPVPLAGRLGDGCVAKGKNQIRRMEQEQ